MYYSVKSLNILFTVLGSTLYFVKKTKVPLFATSPSSYIIPNLWSFAFNSKLVLHIHVIK